MGDPVAADENASAPSCFMSRRTTILKLKKGQRSPQPVRKCTTLRQNNKRQNSMLSTADRINSVNPEFIFLNGQVR
jgi:hypothetical protein